VSWHPKLPQGTRNKRRGEEGLLMPRTCLACATEKRNAIEKALAFGIPLREISGKFRISISALHRHKSHIAEVISATAEKREMKLGDDLLQQMRGVQEKAWELLGKMEAEGDHRGSVVALREVRECLRDLGAMLDRAALVKAAEHSSPCPFCDRETYQQAQIAAVRYALGFDEKAERDRTIQAIREAYGLPEGESNGGDSSTGDSEPPAGVEGEA
jgi:transposase